MVNVEHAQQLTDYLRERGLLGSDEQPRIEVLAGGVSNRTVLVARQAEPDWVIKQALPKLRVEVDWFCEPRRVHAEAQGLKWLAANLPAGCVPGFVDEDQEQHLLIMEAIGQPHVNWKNELLTGRIAMPLVEQFATLLATIHNRSFAQRRRLEGQFADRTFFEALRLEPYYGYAAEQVPPAARFLNQLLADTRASRLTLVHGDYSPKNILVYQQRLILLDHEVIHWGDPAFDLGFSLTHFLSKAHFVSSARDTFLVAARLYWQTYLQSLHCGIDLRQLESRAVRHTLACLLARVAGRSPLEYLEAEQRRRQQRVVLPLMDEPPDSIDDLSTIFVERLQSSAQDSKTGRP